MKKRFISIFIIFLIMPTVLSAASSGELQQKIEQVRQEREVLIKEQKKLETELEAVNKELDYAHEQQMKQEEELTHEDEIQ